MLSLNDFEKLNNKLSSNSNLIQIQIQIQI